MSHLNNITRLLVLCACVFLSGCQKDEMSEPKMILTLQVDAGSRLVGDNWIFATDASGEVLGVEQYSPGKTVTFTSATASDKITVSFFQYNEQPIEATTHQYTFISTYADVPVGTALHIEGPAATQNWSVAKLNFTNVGNMDISFANGSVTAPNYHAGSNGKLDVTLWFYDAPSDVLMTGYRAGVPVYNWATGVKDGDVIARDCETDFTPFPHQVTLDFDGTTLAYVSGQTAQGKTYYMINRENRDSGTPSAKPVIGYVDGFDSYHMTIENTKTNGTVTYEKSGTFNFTPTIPTFTFSKIKDNFLDYAFNFSQDYTYYSIGWGYGEGTAHFSWNMTALAGTTIKELSLPKEITAKYPNPDTGKFQYYGVGFTNVLQGNLFLKSLPGMSPPSGPYESYTYMPTP